MPGTAGIEKERTVGTNVVKRPLRVKGLVAVVPDARVVVQVQVVDCRSGTRNELKASPEIGVGSRQEQLGGDHLRELDLGESRRQAVDSSLVPPLRRGRTRQPDVS